GTITVWDDRRLVGGEDWDREIKNEIGTAELVVLLLSADFLASSYIYGSEMRIAYQRFKEGSIEILPIVVGECQWGSTWLADLNVALNGRLVRGRRSDDKWWNQLLGIILQKVSALRSFRVTEREFEVIERFADDIRSDYTTRNEGARTMHSARVYFDAAELYTRLQEEIQNIRTAVSSIASPIGQRLKSRLELLER